MKNILFSILLFATFSGFSQEKVDSTKLLLDNIAQKQIQYLLDGQVSNYLGIYSKQYTDLGGGPNGDGTIDFEDWQEKLENFVSSEEFSAIKDKAIEELFDIAKMKVFNYLEMLEERGPIKRFSYELKEDDYFLAYPPKEGSIFRDGWFGIFRLEGGVWKIIAGD